MIAEVFLPSFGVLGVGGIVAFVFGGLMLFDIEDPGFGARAGPSSRIALTSAAAIIGVGTFALKARAPSDRQRTRGHDRRGGHRR